MLPLGMTQIYAGQLANKIGKIDYVSTDSTSCISAHAALYQANNLIKLGELDRVIVVASDNGASEEYMHFFGENGLSLLAKDEGKLHKFRLGQGANITVLESEKSLNQTGNAPIAKLHDIKVFAENHTNPLGISQSGSGYSTVISRILENLVDTTPVIDYVKTHSTYSKDNQIEETIITELLGDVKTVNYKSRIGHIMGPSTGVEMHLSIKELGGTFISLGAGMGNVFSAALVETLNVIND
jgi:3-oxoacyl-(acyl-carrier-protein) synthase